MSSVAQAKTTQDFECETEGAEFSSQSYSWYVVVTMMFFYVLSFMDRQIIAVLIEPIKADLNLTDVQISLVGGISFVLFYSIAGVFVGRLADSVNRPLLVGCGVFIWSLTTAFCGFASKFWHLLFLRMGVGLGESALLPSTISLIADYFPKHRLATATSVFLLGAPIGIGAAYTGGGYLYSLAIDITQSPDWSTVPLLGELSAWKLVLFSLGVTGMLMTALLITVREPRNTKTSINGKKRVSSKQTAASIDEVKGYFLNNWKAIGGLYLGMSMIALASYAQGFWDIAFLSRTYGWDPIKGSMWYGAVQVTGGMIGMFGGGFFADKLAGKGVKGASFVVILIGAAIALPFGIAYPLMPSPNSSMLLMVLSILGNNIPYGCAAAAIQRMFPGNMRGLAAGIYFFISNAVGIGIGPTAVAFMTDYIFNDTQLLRYSIASVGSAARAMAFILVFISLDSYRKMLARIEKEGT